MHFDRLELVEINQEQPYAIVIHEFVYLTCSVFAIDTTCLARVCFQFLHHLACFANSVYSLATARELQQRVERGNGSTRKTNAKSDASQLRHHQQR